ncbi:transcription termination factor 2-like [Ciona intestinalis]
MLGTVQSYDQRRRAGFIQGKDGDCLYYFSKSSVADNSLHIRPGVDIEFEPYEYGDKTVAVRIRRSKFIEQEGHSRDNEPFSDYAGPNALPHQYNANPNQSSSSMKNHATTNYMSNHLQSSSYDRPYDHSSMPTSKEHSEGMPLKLASHHRPVHQKVGGESQDSFYSHAKTERGLKNVNRMLQNQEQDSLYSNAEAERGHQNVNRMPQNEKQYSLYSNAETERGLKNVNRMLQNEEQENVPFEKKMNEMHISQAGYPLKNIALVQPLSKETGPKNRGDARVYQSSIKQHFTPVKEGKSAPQLQQKPLTKDQQILLTQIEQKKKLLRGLDLSKLPDRGKRMKDQISDLEAQFTEMRLKQPEEEVSIFKDREVPVIKQSSEHRRAILIDLTDESDAVRGAGHEVMPRNHVDNYYGGRMTANRLNAVTRVTSEAIELLHTSLETCPPAASEVSDPKGLKVKLMTHQRQALAWLIWREKESISGGILADDMGLGKTLTMISLILKQLQKVNQVVKVKEEAPSEATNERVVNSKVKTEITSKYFSVKEEVKDDVSEDQKNEDEIDNLFPSNSTLILAPASLIFHWKNEINNRCHKDLLSIHLYHGKDRERDAEKLAQFDVVITTYDVVRRTHPKPPKQTDFTTDTKTVTTDTKSDPLEHALFLIKWRRVILDEAHQIRNFKSQTSMAACALNAHSRWAMSGTPVQNQESDMYAMIKFLHCSPFDEHKLWKNQVSNNTIRGQQRLKTLVSCLVLRREKNQRGLDGKPLVKLPERKFEVHKLKLNDVEREVYDKLKTESQAAYKSYEHGKDGSHRTNHIEEKKKLSATTLLVMLLRLRQCCGHLHLLQGAFDPELLQKEKEEIAVEDLFQSMSIGASSSSFSSDNYSDKSKAKYFEISQPSSKITFVMDTLKKLSVEKPDDKCVIISQWTSMLNILAHHLKAAKFSYAVIDGSVNARKRMELVDNFNKNPVKPKIMLISLQAGGVGLNLIGGNHLFLLDMHWNPALEKQAFDRIYRVGQKKEVFVHKFIMVETVEEQILQLQERKLSIAKAVMEGAGVENKVKLTLADMKVLFGI